MTAAPKSDTAPRHFLELRDFDGPQLRALLARATELKARRGEVRAARPFDGRTLALIFEQSSTRTRLSFDLAMRELGGDTIVMTGKEMQLGRGESIADTARVLSRFVDAIMIRTLDPDAVEALARAAAIPVINGLTYRSHPCQIMADVMTFEEHKGDISGRVVAWTGPYNNVLRSWIEASARMRFEMRVAVPETFAVPDELRAWAADHGDMLELLDDPASAVTGADCVVTDCWTSMGEDETQSRHNQLLPYQVNTALMKRAPDAIFMHCLPAHRGEEVTDEVMDGPQSVVFDEAENRLHAQKGILDWCLSSGGP